MWMKPNRMGPQKGPVSLARLKAQQAQIPLEIQSIMDSEEQGLRSRGLKAKDVQSSDFDEDTIHQMNELWTDFRGIMETDANELDIEGETHDS